MLRALISLPRLSRALFPLHSPPGPGWKVGELKPLDRDLCSRDGSVVGTPTYQPAYIAPQTEQDSFFFFFHAAAAGSRHNDESLSMG